MIEVADATSSDVAVTEGDAVLELLLGTVLNEVADDEVEGSVLDEISIDEVEETEITVTASTLELLLDGTSELESERDVWLLVGVVELSTPCELLVVLSVTDGTVEDTASCEEVELIGSELDELCATVSELLDDVVGDSLADEDSEVLKILELVVETIGKTLIDEDSELLELVTSLDMSGPCD